MDLPFQYTGLTLARLARHAVYSMHKVSCPCRSLTFAFPTVWAFFTMDSKHVFSETSKRSNNTLVLHVVYPYSVELAL
jgi:hypothetical protein